MTLQIPAGFAQVTLEFSGLSPLGSTPVTTFGVDRAPSDALGDAVYAWWHDSFRPLQDSNTQLLRIVMRSDVGFYETTVGEAGTHSVNGTSPQTAALIRKVTGQAGRSNRGRMFWPHVITAGDVLETGTLDPALVADIQSSCGDLVTALDTAEATLQLFHTASSDPTAVTELRAMAQVATQRRRNRK